MKQTQKRASKVSATDSIEYAAERLQKAERELQATMEPIRRSVLERFPILFTLLTAFGVAAVFFGFERILSEIAFLNNRPWLILLLGIIVLSSTGTLYKMLGRSRH